MEQLKIDIKKIEDAIATLSAGGVELFGDALAELQVKLATLKQQAADEAARLETEVKSTEQAVVTDVQAVVVTAETQYGPVVLEGAKIVLLLIILLKLFGKI